MGSARCKQQDAGTTDKECSGFEHPPLRSAEDLHGASGREDLDCNLYSCDGGLCNHDHCDDSNDCAPGATCVELDGRRTCHCETNLACPTGKVCGATGDCTTPFSEGNRQISCELSEPAAGVGAWMLIVAAALAARRRSQKGTATNPSGSQSTKGP